MKYKLAKELKDAGFQKFGFDVDTTGTIMPNVVNEPTLSELIDACDEGMELFIGDEGSTSVRTKYHSGKGKTPEEAVAKLWLELNK